MAECFLTENKYYKVYEVLKHCRSEMNRYRFALVCLKLHKYEGKTDKKQRMECLKLSYLSKTIS